MSFPAAFNPEGFRGPCRLGRFRQESLQSLAWDGAVPAPSLRIRLVRVAAAGRDSRARSEGKDGNVLIVGAGPMGRKLAAILEREHIDGRAVVGFLDEARAWLAGDVLGRVEEPCPHRARANSWTKSSWRFPTGTTWRNG